MKFLLSQNLASDGLLNHLFAHAEWIPKSRFHKWRPNIRELSRKYADHPWISIIELAGLFIYLQIPLVYN